MKKALLFCILATMLAGAMAQDVITLRSGEEIQAKVSEVTPTEIKYRRFDNPEGPTYTVNKGDVFMVKYQNGTKEIMKEEPKIVSNEVSYNDYRMRKWTNQREVGVSAFADLGGFGFTGSRLGMEVRWRQLWVNAFMKFASIGALNNAYLGDEGYVIGDFSGFGGGFTVKCLFPFKNGHAIHLGIINEWTNYDFVQKNGELIRNSNTDCGSTGLGLGYSYHTQKGFYFTIGGYWGVSVFDETRTYNDPSYGGSDSWTAFYGTAEVTIGYEFTLVKH